MLVTRTWNDPLNLYSIKQVQSPPLKDPSCKGGSGRIHVIEGQVGGEEMEIS